MSDYTLDNFLDRMVMKMGVLDDEVKHIHELRRTSYKNRSSCEDYEINMQDVEMERQLKVLNESLEQVESRIESLVKCKYANKST
ncbi:hypothetical protein BGX33_012342 [Mortierella sp. NVP41]|nr:hypothetical protein BGX33_012342 [Mortierella sp. NVP41]